MVIHAIVRRAGLSVIVGLSSLLMSTCTALAQDYTSLDNYRYIIDRIDNTVAYNLPGLPFLVNNQQARLTNGTTSDVYVAANVKDYCTYENSFEGQCRRDLAKTSGVDPKDHKPFDASRYEDMIAKDEAIRQKLVDDHKLVAVPYNTKVQVIEYKDWEKFDEIVLLNTGNVKRFGRYRVRILEGPNQGLEVWTTNVQDLQPHQGDPAFLGIAPGEKTPGGIAIKTGPIVGFDESDVSYYWQAVLKGDDATAAQVLDNKSVLSLDQNTKCTVLKEDKYVMDNATYLQVMISGGPNTGKIFWTNNVALTRFVTSSTDK